MKKLIVFLFLFILIIDVSAQSRRKKRRQKAKIEVVQSDVVPAYTAAINRQLYHDQVDKEQKLLLNSDMKYDSLFTLDADIENNKAITKAITNYVDWAQYEIETNSKADHRVKTIQLAGLTDIVKNVRYNWRKQKGLISDMPDIISAYRQCLQLQSEGKSIEPVVSQLSYNAASLVAMPKVFGTQSDELKKLLILKASAQQPQKTFELLKAYPDAPFADSLIKIMAKKFPQQAYDYVQANNKLSYRIQNITDDKLVETIVAISRNDDRNGQYYFPFLDNIVKDKITLKEIDAAKNDAAKYFKLLVKTQMDYVNRAQQGDTATGFRELTARLQKKAEDDFVAKINGLHNASDAVRFRCLQSLNPEELYYVAVLTDGLIYTSSYTAGVYPLMMRKMGNKGDDLLKKVHFDHYRKFISQAAAYNTLRNFLGSFKNQDDAHTLMKTFVSGLEKTDGLEDGVDVADSYASLYETLPDLAKEMLQNVSNEYDRNKKTNNEKGIAIYNILLKLFQSADPANNIDLTKELGIPPVYKVPFNSLTNENGEVIAQVFFYGDQDGRNIFNGFLNMFGGGNWKIDGSNKQWVVIKSTKGKPVSIYANRALNEEKGEDDAAQRALIDYLDEKNLQPTVTIHRGHSYYSLSTIGYMAPTSKIVFMGSCGGFNLIDSILKVSDDAHIIASKQIGKTAINKPFFNLLTEKLRNGEDIDWIPFWKEFKQRAKVAGFEDYIPPYKNLGAIFIKAYRQETEDVDG